MLVPDSPNRTLKGDKLLLLTPWPPPAAQLAQLRARFPDLAVSARQQAWDAAAPGGDDADDAAALWRDVTVLVTGRALPAPGQAPRLRYVQLLSAGAEHVLDAPALKDDRVVLCTANGVHGPQISEWVIATYLALQHKIPTYLQHQREGRWERLAEPPDDAVGKTVGILGYGSIGRQTARVARALGMAVHAYTLHPRPTPASRRDPSYAPPGLGDPDGVLPRRWFAGGSAAALHAFLGSGLDLLVVAAPLTPRTRGLVGRAELAALEGRGAVVSNVARGPVVDTDALVEALRAGEVAGAALDVTDPEPLPAGHPLWAMGNVIVTPHTSGASTAYAARVLDVLELNLGRLSEGRELLNVVSRKDGY